MSAGIPSEIAWLVPLVFPFLIGLFTGMIVKRGVKLMLAIVGLILILSATGYISLSFGEIYDKAMTVLPKLFQEAQGSFRNVLPVSAPSFVVGLGIGFWIS